MAVETFDLSEDFKLDEILEEKQKKMLLLEYHFTNQKN